jgi:hypothetical protein
MALVAVLPEGLRLQAPVAVGALAAEGDLDRFPEQERAQLFPCCHLHRPLARLDADVDRPRRQRADQAQLAQELSITVRDVDLASLFETDEELPPQLQRLCLPAVGAALRHDPVTL